uniref:Large ribosomal subunit protein eL14 domain-containing protein n=1 Tax=Strombidium inclinatum TaxID=197538 RepID=A0A7S3IV46_9SPIT|mmetsp:Transcript_42003/g.64321  ORF Transcript_42003/g.64321 Transcript_42003/m.64321 type:complete len:133 (+) Transcript_42003:79-477(+)
MGLRDFVEPGRVCYINFGEDYGKLVVIADFVDMNRVLVDGLKNFPRVIYPLKRLTLTRMKLPVLRGAKTGTLVKAAKAFDLDKKWKDTKANQKMERFNKRKETTDFDRFKVMVLRRQKSYEAKKLAKKIAKK